MTWLRRKPAAQPAPAPAARGISGLFGHAHGTRVVIVTTRGVELPIRRDCGWGVVALSCLLGEIDSLPEVTPESRRA